MMPEIARLVSFLTLLCAGLGVYHSNYCKAVDMLIVASLLSSMLYLVVITATASDFHTNATLL